MVSKRGKRRLVVAAARRLAIDLWRWVIGRATAQELGLQFRLTGRLILHVSGGKRSKKGSTAKDLRATTLRKSRCRIFVARCLEMPQPIKHTAQAVSTRVNPHSATLRLVKVESGINGLLPTSWAPSQLFRFSVDQASLRTGR
jgi:hypothetical protein